MAAAPSSLPLSLCRPTRAQEAVACLRTQPGRFLAERAAVAGSVCASRSAGARGGVSRRPVVERAILVSVIELATAAASAASALSTHGSGSLAFLFAELTVTIGVEALHHLRFSGGPFSVIQLAVAVGVKASPAAAA